jgi:hypothetical protein
VQRWRLVLLGLGCLGLAGCALGQPPPAADDAGTVVETFLAARAARDLDATMATFDDVPEIHSSRGINWSGRDAVRAIMAYRLLDSYSVGERHVSGNIVTWTEHVRRALTSGGPPANFDEDVEATVGGGHIKRLVTSLGAVRAAGQPLAEGIAPSPTPAERTSPVTPLVVPLSIGLLILAVLVWPWSENEVRRVPSGRLLVGLRRYAESHAVQGQQERR